MVARGPQSVDHLHWPTHCSAPKNHVFYDDLRISGEWLSLSVPRAGPTRPHPHSAHQSTWNPKATHHISPLHPTRKADGSQKRAPKVQKHGAAVFGQARVTTGGGGTGPFLPRLRSPAGGAIFPEAVACPPPPPPPSAQQLLKSGPPHCSRRPNNRMRLAPQPPVGHHPCYRSHCAPHTSDLPPPDPVARRSHRVRCMAEWGQQVHPVQARTMATVSMPCPSSDPGQP